MARGKVKHEYIDDKSSREVSFKKRKRGLKKKMTELSTLCGVEACATIYGSNNSTPDVWPNQDEALRVLDRFKSLPEVKQGKQMVGQEAVLEDKIPKMEEKIRRQQELSQNYEMTDLMDEILKGKTALDNLGTEDFTAFASYADQTMKEVQERISDLRGVPMPLLVAPSPVTDQPLMDRSKLITKCK